MNFSKDTIIEAIARAHSLPMFATASQEAATALILHFCGEIEAKKVPVTKSKKSRVTT